MTKKTKISIIAMVVGIICIVGGVIAYNQFNKKLVDFNQSTADVYVKELFNNAEFVKEINKPYVTESGESLEQDRFYYNVNGVTMEVSSSIAGFNVSYYDMFNFEDHPVDSNIDYEFAGDRLTLCVQMYVDSAQDMHIAEDDFNKLIADLYAYVGEDKIPVNKCTKLGDDIDIDKVPEFIIAVYDKNMRSEDDQIFITRAACYKNCGKETYNVNNGVPSSNIYEQMTTAIANYKN